MSGWYSASQAVRASRGHQEGRKGLPLGEAKCDYFAYLFSLKISETSDTIFKFQAGPFVILQHCCATFSNENFISKVHKKS